MLSKLLKYPLLLITLLLALCLFVGSASAWIRPSTSMLPTYLGVAFPAIALLNILMGLFWITKFKWYLAIPTLSIILCGHNLQKTIGLHKQSGKATETEGDEGKKLKILSYNVKLFDFYNKKTQILNYLLEQDADVVCLQEFGYYTGSETRFLDRKMIMAEMAKKYPHHHFSQSDLKMKGTYGMATFSKYPMVKHENVGVESRYESAIYSDLKVGNDTVRVINLHLESNKLTTSDRNTLQHLLVSDSTNNKAKALNKKISEAYNIREKQADKVAELVNASTMPVVICADINDVPVSYTYSTLIGQKLTDSFVEKGTGYGATYNEGLIKFRIDDIMHSKELKALSYKKDKVPYSDHYPIVVELGIGE
ncbi:MAG: endonuclease/exonuclease/phosphatase family protein [Paludibacteraceae bacterium]|nr:endonuclease/exonuclease/phosphatase family protein [Paludibacteraceae bacterium]